MARKNKKNDLPPLSHYWSPPETIAEDGVGRPWACLATTYEFHAPFFEAELLPRWMGLKLDHTENEASFLVEREEALSLAPVAVLVDHQHIDFSQTTMSWDQIPVQVPGGILHAKISILAWERLVRVIIGSANLTRNGYRKNREIFAALDFWDDPESVPATVLRNVLELLEVILGWSRVVRGAVDRAEDTIRRLRQVLDSWDYAPEDFTPRERPRVALAATHPSVGSLAARSALDELAELWRRRRATCVTVVTPFVAQPTSKGAKDVVVEKLKSLPRSRDCESWLVVPEKPRTSEDEVTRIPLPEAFGRSWDAGLGTRGCANVLPIPLCVEGKEDRNRDLHTKAVVIESDDDALLMIGSSNFTPGGMGIGKHNVEANLVFEDWRHEKREGTRLGDRLGLPREWNEGVSPKDVVWEEPPEPPEDEPKGTPALPKFFAWASYSQVSGELRIGVDRDRDEPSAWRVRLPGADTDELAPLFSSEYVQPDPQAKDLVYVFPPEQRAIHLVALTISWTDDEGQQHEAKLGVCVESKDDLLPPGEYRKLGADAIIACLISGKSPALWYDRNGTGDSRKTKNEAGIDSLRSVDTSSYLLYRVRQFGRALISMCNRIDRTVVHTDAIRYRLQKDPFGPVSLAKTIANVDAAEETNWCARLASEHRVYLLSELVLAVAHLRKRFEARTSGSERADILASFDKTDEQLRSFLDSLGGSDEDDLPENLSEYIERVYAATGTGSTVTERGRI